VSWLDLLGSVAGLGGIAGEARSYLRGQVISQAVSAGASANSILRALSANGLGVRRNQGLDLVAQEKSRQLASAGAGQVPFGATADQALAGAPHNWTGNYVHQVTTTYRTKDEEGNYLLHTRTIGLKGTTALTPEQAVQAAMDIMATSAIGEAGEGRYPMAGAVLSASLSGVWYDTQGRNLPFTH